MSSLCNVREDIVQVMKLHKQLLKTECLKFAGHMIKLLKTRYNFLFQIPSLQSNRKYAQKIPLSIGSVKERVILVLQLYDKVDPEKVHIVKIFSSSYKNGKKVIWRTLERLKQRFFSSFICFCLHIVVCFTSYLYGLRLLVFDWGSFWRGTCTV